MPLKMRVALSNSDVNYSQVLYISQMKTAILFMHVHHFPIVKADLHGAILSHATSLRHAYDTKKVVGFENMF